MRRSKLIIVLASLLLCLALTAVALAESALGGLWTSGCDFLFHTHNVTVTGEASFSLDGESFKTAQLHYIQDGRSSFYGLKLLTPRADGSERETGWTIISDESGNLSVMEAYRPGVYRRGSCAANNTLLRHSIQLDALTELGGLLVGQAEPLLPEGAVTVSDTDGGRTVRIAVSEETMPAFAGSALNLAANYLAGRWFSYVPDRTIVQAESLPFGSYTTVTEALANGTVRWTLRGADATFTLDAQGRLTGVRGEAQAASTFWDGSVREVEIRFELTASDYGVSHVKPFDPDDYNVVLDAGYYGEPVVEDAWLNMDQETRDAWLAKAETLLTAQGFSISADAARAGWCEDDIVKISILNENGQGFFFGFAEDGRLLSLDALTVAVVSIEEANAAALDADAVAEAEKLIRAFLSEQNPPLAESMGEMTVQNLMTMEDGGRCLSIECAGEGYFVVRIAPSLRLEYYAANTSG